eukprot:TRINITY_DN2873_c0_g1_i1.p4 TRINITY_DN2873_c0_g1~~TRINITY_DN2873_c0_g1_i1.p4  ORF type:complete len:80 (+),score=17.06 TRINITY_DN2873_c0_g1_i1:286-525(+)
MGLASSWSHSWATVTMCDVKEITGSTNRKPLRATAAGPARRQQQRVDDFSSGVGGSSICDNVLQFYMKKEKVPTAWPLV